MRKLIETTTTGVGEGQHLVEAKPNNVFSEHGVQIATDLGATAVTVDLEGSLDGVAWFQLVQHVLGAPELAAGQAMFFTNLSPVTHVRANVVVNTGGNNVLVLYVGTKGG